MDTRIDTVTDEMTKAMNELSGVLCKVGLELKEAGFPLCGGYDGDYPDELKDKARLLNSELNHALRHEPPPNGCSAMQPKTGVLSEHAAEKLRILVASGMSQEEYSEQLRLYGFSERCNVVWPTDVIAYRCSTCALNPCMSLCADCFNAADHSGHDYSRFFSLAGGACDCGNPDVLDPKGFCARHGKPASEDVPKPPAALTATAEFVFVKLLVRMLNAYRQWKAKYDDVQNTKDPLRDPLRSTLQFISNDLYEGSEPIVLFLQEMADWGAPLRDCLAALLLDKNLYQLLTDPTADDDQSAAVDPPDENLGWPTISNLREDIGSLKEMPMPLVPGSRVKLSRSEPIQCECILDEIVFYLIRLAFPQPLINLVLSLLSDVQYKDLFARRFFQYYPYTTGMVCRLLHELPNDSTEPSKITSRIIHISVQICSSEKMCRELQEQINVIDKVLDSAIRVAYFGARPNQIDHSPQRFYAKGQDESIEEDESSWLTMDVEENKFVSRYGHWYLITDAQNLLSHHSMGLFLYSNAELCEKYAVFVASMQGMNAVYRIVTGDHAEYESQSLYAIQRAFTLEWETCSMIMFNTMAAISSEHLYAMRNVFDCFIRLLEAWFVATNLEKSLSSTQCPPFVTSFHIPLHRHVSTAIRQSLMLGGEFVDLVETRLSSEDLLRKAALHPIRISVTRAEYHSGMWMRNGNPIRNQVSLYGQSTITHGMQNPDIELIRFCAARMNQEFFLHMLFDSFHLYECFDFDDSVEDVESKDDERIITRRAWVSFMFDGCLRLLLELIALRTNTGISAEENLRMEIVAALAFADFPHSKLKSLIPEAGNDLSNEQTRLFDRVLDELAVFQEPDSGETIQHGRYRLKDSIWRDEFDPVMCRTRCYSLREYNSLMLRAEAVDAKLAGQQSPGEHLWLGYRLLDFDAQDRFETLRPAFALLTQPSFFYICTVVLRKALKSDNLQSLVLQQCIYLLTLSAKFVNSKCFATVRHRFFQPSDEKNPFTPKRIVSNVRDAKDPKAAVMDFFMSCAFDEKYSLLQLIVLHFEKSQGYPASGVTKSGMCMELKKYVDRDPTSLDRLYGSGTEYIGRLLSWINYSDSKIANALQQLYQQHVVTPGREITPESRDELPLSSSPEVALKERKLAAKRKQAALMNAQKVKQMQLMQKMMAKEGLTQQQMDDMDTKQADEVLVYECPICNDTSTNTLHSLMGLVVAARPNSVVENSLAMDEEDLSLMDIGQLTKQYGRVPTRRVQKFWNATKDGLLYSAYGVNACNVRMPSGVEVKTCGHSAHLACFRAYADTIREANNVAVGCPMCRAPVNGILPLKPDIGCERVRLAFDPSQDSYLPQVFELIRSKISDGRTLYSEMDENSVMRLKEYQQQFHDFGVVCRHFYENPMIDKKSSEANQFHARGYHSFILGIVKGNIERQQLMEHQEVSIRKPMHNVLPHLLCGSRFEAVRRDTSAAVQAWDLLTEKISPHRTLPGITSSLPPILLYEPKSLMLRLMVYVFADNSLVDADKLAVSLVIYRLSLAFTLCRVVTHILTHTTSDVVQELLASETLSKIGSPISEACDFICQSIRGSLNTLIEPTNPAMLLMGGASVETLISTAEHVATELSEFFYTLVEELSLTTAPQQRPKSFYGIHEELTGSRSIKHSIEFTKAALSTWVTQLDNAAYKTPIHTIVMEDRLVWRPHLILPLPKSYDELFALFFGQACINCAKAPTHPMICLLCGELCCLDRCCDIDVGVPGVPPNEVERHAAECGTGCGVFLALNSTLVAVIRNELASLWGSVYLDSYGEEDRNLKRGKPLYLSETRLERLRRDWMEQNFGHRPGTRQWFAIEYLSQFLKECHFF